MSFTGGLRGFLPHAQPSMTARAIPRLCPVSVPFTDILCGTKRGRAQERRPHGTQEDSPEMQEQTNNDCRRAPWKKYDEHGRPLPYPLERFPAERQREIAEAVARDTPPPRWLDLGMAQIESRAWFEWHLQRGVDPRKRRPHISPRLREAVIERDGYVCQLCGGDVEPADVHLDHKHPHSLAGATTIGNLQVAHSVCNMRKGARHEL